MLETLDRSMLRDLCDRAMLLLSLAGGCRSEIVGLDVARDQTRTVAARSKFSGQGHAGYVAGQDPWREVEIARGSSDATCPVVAPQTWLKLVCIAHGPLFRRVTGHGKTVGAERLNAQQARPVKRAVAAGVRGIFASAAKGFLAIRCALASRPQPRSTNAMCKSSWPRQHRDDPQAPAASRSFGLTSPRHPGSEGPSLPWFEAVVRRELSVSIGIGK